MGALIVLASATVVAACDQASKALAYRRGETVFGRGGLGFRLFVNTRGAAVPLPASAAVSVWLAVALGAALAVVLAPVFPWTATLGLGFALGGAAGNLVDRIARDGVVDFIVVWRWPAFNLADAALVCGAALCAWSLV